MGVYPPYLTITTVVGVHQGSTLSLWLFILCMDEVTADLQQQQQWTLLYIDNVDRMRLSYLKVYSVDFAALTAKHDKELQNMKQQQEKSNSITLKHLLMKKEYKRETGARDG